MIRFFKESALVNYIRSSNAIFFVVFFAMQIVSGLGLIVTGGNAIYNILWNGPSGAAFPDFIETMFQAYGRHPYSVKGIYPPLVYLLFSFAGKMMPSDVVQLFHVAQDSGEWTMLSINPAMHSFALFFLALSSVGVCILLWRERERTGVVQAGCIIWVFLTCAPFLFCFERGNVVLLVILLMLFYCLFYNHENVALRLIAFLCFAISVSFKLYPVFFGILLFRSKKRLFNISICGLMTVALLILPFAFVDGGFGSIDAMLNNINVASLRALQLVGPAQNISLASDCQWVSYLFGVNASDDAIRSVSTGLSCLSCLLCVVFAIISRDEWRRVALITIACIITPSLSVIYNLLYLIIPVVFFFIHIRIDGINSFGEKCSSVLFATSLAPCAIGPLDFIEGRGFVNMLNLGTIVPSISVLLLCVVLIGMELIALCKRVKQLGACNAEQSKYDLGERTPEE